MTATNAGRHSARDDMANFAVGCVAVAMVLAVGFALADSGTNAVFGAVVRYLPLVLFGLLLMPALVVIARRPQRGVLLLAAFVPFYGLLIIAPAKPPFAEGWKEALALYTLFWSLLSTPKRTRTRTKLPLVIQPILLYLSFGLIWVVALHNVRGIVGFKVNFFWLVLGIIVWRTPLNARDRDRLVSILMVVTVITSLVGLAQQVVGDAFLVSLGYDYNTNVRFTGSFVRSFSTMDNPFNFAFFLTFALLILLPQCLEDPRRQRNTAFLVATPVVGLALLFTFVRGAWLALAVGCCYLAVRRYKVFLLFVPFVMLASLLVPGNFSESALATGSLGDRQQGWAQNINKAVSAPFGNGIGATGAAGLKAQQVERTNQVVYEPDNQYFKALYELGVFGLWALGLLLVGLVLTSRAMERRVADADRAWALGLSAHVLGAIAAASISTWFEIFPNDLFLWMTLAVVLTLNKNEPEARALPSARSRYEVAAVGSRPMPES